ncbi:MAG TPA: hypothetical protein VH475_24800 [Tepidisphaeraceae bacterium]|jgi:hypothetical protein
MDPKSPVLPHARHGAAAAQSPAIVARPSNEYRLKRYVIVAMLIGMGAWFAWDGFVAWPRENAKIEQLRKDGDAARKANDEEKVRRIDAEIGTLKLHTQMDLNMQKVLAFLLPPLGLVVLAWSLRNSRGVYRLNDNILNVPGHPPVPLDAIRSIDKTDWDRKGIAYVNYELINGAKGSLRLDDFIYQRTPTDEIFKYIEAYTGTGDAPAADTRGG